MLLEVVYRIRAAPIEHLGCRSLLRLVHSSRDTVFSHSPTQGIFLLMRSESGHSSYTARHFIPLR
jgi:hypothetical protein